MRKKIIEVHVNTKKINTKNEDFKDLLRRILAQVGSIGKDVSMSDQIILKERSWQEMEQECQDDILIIVHFPHSSALNEDRLIRIRNRLEENFRYYLEKNCTKISLVPEEVINFSIIVSDALVAS